jgi:formate hydrogenlyase transcriptional activator
MNGPVDEVRQLKKCVNNLVSMLTLPAVWTGGEMHQIATAFLDVLLNMLQLEWVYVRLKNTAHGAPIEMTRHAQFANTAEHIEIVDEILENLSKCRTQVWPVILPRSTAEERLSIAVFRLGLNDEMGILVAGSRRPEFPDVYERLLLNAATNQATIALHESRLLAEQRRLAEELDQMVTQRTFELDRFFTISLDLLCIADKQGYFRGLNQSWESTLGYTRSELLARPFMEFVHPDDVSKTRAAYVDVIAGKNVVNFVNRYRCKTGEYRWLEWSAVSGDHLVYATARDITERNRTKAELQQSEFYLAEGQRLAHTGSWAFNPSGFFYHWSRELFDIYGLNPDAKAPTLEEYLNLIHSDDRESMARTIEQMVAKQLGCDLKKRIVRPNGEVRYIRCVGIPVVVNGTLKEIVGTAMDVTEQEVLTQELQRRQEYLAEAQNLSHTGSFGWKPLSGEICWSDETFRIFELDPSTKPTLALILQCIHAEDRAVLEEVIERATSGSNGFDLEHRLLMPDGRIKHVHVVGRAVKDDSGNPEFVGAVTDVTKRREASEALQRAFHEIGALRDQLYKENLALKEEIDRSSMLEEIVGASPALQKVLLRVSKVARTDSTVLITGETGTGKELIARAVHKRSARSERPFVSVNCAAIPQSLLASELFGHEKGAFTGAMQRRLGRFELANGGTIFLDEIGELPNETQIALLRVLQEREFERVGGQERIRADVRVIAATNRALEAAIVAGTFRSDLYYRLNVFPIAVPPLRERKEDIPMLVEYFVDRYASKAGKRIRRIKTDLMDRLIIYPWPGNIRELQNVIERSVILCETEDFSVDESWLSPPTFSSTSGKRPLTQELESQQKEMIEVALAECKGRVSGPSGAAARLGIPSSTLESKIRSLKINKQHFAA